MKRLLALLLATVLVLGLAACGAPAEKPAETAAKPEESPEETAPAAKVLYWNRDPALEAALQSLAAAYAANTGVEVQIVTGEGMPALDGADAPTVFTLDGSEDRGIWSAQALDLSGSALAEEIPGDAFRIYDGSGALRGLAYAGGSFGLIVNTALLEKAGYTLEDITDFATLKLVSDSIHARRPDLKFDAFAACGLWDADSARRFTGYVANIPLFYEFRDAGIRQTPAAVTGAYLPCLRAIWDLMTIDSFTNEALLTNYTEAESEATFTEGRAVFYPQGSWAYASLAEKMDPADLAMIPLYCGAPGEENLGLSTGGRAFWAVNAQASPEEQQAALDFLCWLASSDEGIRDLQEVLGTLPFRGAEAADPFSQQARSLEAAGKYNVDWAFLLTPNASGWQRSMTDTLARYAMDPVNEAYWTDVTAAFVDGWAIEYAIMNR